jgi:hypothetical protein
VDEHPLMTAAVTLMAEFSSQEVTVLRIVAACADEHPEWKPPAVEEAARARLRAWVREHDDEKPAN